MNGPLQLGTARVEITPKAPMPLAGFAHRSGVFERVHSPLFLRALYFAQAGVEALLISADIFCWGSDLRSEVCDSLSRHLGLRRDAVILHATHNHSGPQTSRLFSRSLGAADERYLQFLRDAAVRAGEAARGNLEPITLERGSGLCNIGIHRRKSIAGEIRMAPNPEGPVDPEVTVLRFGAGDRNPKALLVHYTCHPTVSGANEVGAEYCGLAMAEIEDQFPVVATFLQGCCGDIRPALVRDGEFYRGDAGDAAAVAADLAREVQRVLSGGMTSCAPGALVIGGLETPVPLQPAPAIAELSAQQEGAGIIGEWSRLLLAEPERLNWSPTLESTRLELADGVGLITFNAEMVVEYGLYAKTTSQRRLLPVGYSNGMIGYVPTRRQIEEGGYESAEAFRYYAYAAALAPEAEAAVMAHIRRLA